MASPETIQELSRIRQDFDSIDKDKIYRTDLGIASLEKDLKPRVDETIEKIEFAIQVSEAVSERIVQAVTSIFSEVLNQISTISHLENSSYVSRAEDQETASVHICGIDEQLDDLKQHWPHFIAAAVEKQGLLDDEGIKTQHQRALEELRQEAEKNLENLKEESAKVLEQAAKTAEEIKDKARLTAAGISVEAAQKQFDEAQKEFKERAFGWGVISSLLILAFILVAIYFVNHSRPDEKISFGIIYFTALRIAILAAIGGAAAFCLKIFRANMHMRAHNLHRQRLANSMAAFVESASTNEQRDLILAHLVDAIASFGSSGLLTKPDDSVSPSKMTIDTINRTFSGTSQ